eukprot:TRINITY_DN8312_c0_g1_i4.p1 TRINITY_DN8312_c0_g1~~TRINITY_DN8312_c0_g1_i4.p1  ORF type:complete len:460 (+),score=52.22 TRINITY_DN8312_c0_g1_i4:176-1555(+)
MASLFDKLGKFSELYKILIRPPRKQYSLRDLGKADFHIGQVRVARADFSVANRRNETLQGSIFTPQMPIACRTIVIFLHGNAGCRLDGFPLLKYLIPCNIALASFDFSGSGLSDGEYVTYGCNERDDVEVVINYVMQTYPSLQNVILWGRSMGAATALMFAARDSSKIVALVADSPFSSMTDASTEFFKDHVTNSLPNFLVQGILNRIRNQVIDKTGVDVFERSPKEDAKNIQIPVLLCCANNDELTKLPQVREIFEILKDNNKLNRWFSFEGSHHSERGEELFGTGMRFLTSVIDARPRVLTVNIESVRHRVPPQNRNSTQKEVPTVSASGLSSPTLNAILAPLQIPSTPVYQVSIGNSELPSSARNPGSNSKVPQVVNKVSIDIRRDFSRPRNTKERCPSWRIFGEVSPGGSLIPTSPTNKGRLDRSFAEENPLNISAGSNPRIFDVSSLSLSLIHI